MEHILLSYCLSKENVSAIMMLYRNTKTGDRLPDENTDFFDIAAVVLLGDSLALF